MKNVTADQLMTVEVREISPTEEHVADPLSYLKIDLKSLTEGFKNLSGEVKEIESYNISALTDDLSDLRGKQNISMADAVTNFSSSKLWSVLFETQEGVIFVVISMIIGMGTVPLH